MPDHLTLSGANELARRIRGYWAAKGKTVNTAVEAFRIRGSGGNIAENMYCVRSDMVNGTPQ